MSNDNRVMTRKDIMKAEDLILSPKQLNIIFAKTPPKFIKQRPAKGGGKWNYVQTAYFQKCLNLMFGFDWDFEIIDEKILDKQVIVKGKLTCRAGGKQIIKMQYGRKDIAFKKDSTEQLDLGNDLKAAASDALKKCASEIGIAGDIYGGDDFKEMVFSEEAQEVAAKEELLELYSLKKEMVPPENQIDIERILNNDETVSYNKVKSYLQSL